MGFQALIDRVVGFLEQIAQRLAAPVRGLHVGIGHGTVTAALLLGACAVFAVWIHAETIAELERPALDALARQRDAAAADVESRLDGRVVPSTFELVSADVDAGGITVQAFRPPGARELVIHFETPSPTAPLGSSRAGVIRWPFDDETQPEDGWAERRVPSTSFRSTWSSNGFLQLRFSLLFAGGRVAQGPRQTIRIP